MPAADGKMRETDCAATETLFRIIESVPSKRAEPIKQFLAKAGAEHIEERANPSKAIDRALDNYRHLGRDEEWIDHRLQNISARNELTDEWDKRGLMEGEKASLTADMSKRALGVTPAEHKRLKGLSYLLPPADSPLVQHRYPHRCNYRANPCLHQPKSHGSRLPLERTVRAHRYAQRGGGGGLQPLLRVI